jgi:hypothetical protein
MNFKEVDFYNVLVLAVLGGYIYFDQKFNSRKKII